MAAEPALGGVQGLDERRGGAGEGVAGAEGVAAAGNPEEIEVFPRPSGGREEAVGLGDGDGLVRLAVDEEPGRRDSGSGG